MHHDPIPETRQTTHSRGTSIMLVFAPLILPWFILMAIAMSGEEGCDGEMGKEEIVPTGTPFYIAISDNAKQVDP